MCHKLDEAFLEKRHQHHLILNDMKLKGVMNIRKEKSQIKKEGTEAER